MQRFAALSIGALLMAACSSTTGPLPCSDDLHCPAGSYCGAGGTCAVLPSSFSIAITPASPSVTVSKTLQFTVTGDGGATWSVQEPSGGSIAADGTYQAPATPGTFHILATSTADSTKTAATTVNVVAVPVATVSAPTLVEQGATGLTASVADQPGNTFAWTIAGGTITAGDGTHQITFTAGTGSSVSLTCVVTNAAGTSASGSAAVTVSSTPLEPQINAPAALDQGATSVSISINNPSAQLIYQWTITGGTFADGSMSATGSTQSINTGSGTSLTLNCTATNSANQSAMSTATISLVPATQVPSISTPGYLTVSKTTTLSITSAQTGVTFAWTLTASNGSSFGTTAPAQPVITATGASVSLTAGATTGDVQLAVTATNAANDQRTATAVVHVVSSVVADAPTVVINPGSAFPGYLTRSAQGVTAMISNPITDGSVTYQWTIAGGTLTSAATGDSVTFNAGSGASVTLQAIAYNQANDPSPTGDEVDTLVDLPGAPTINGTAATVSSGVAGKGASIAAPASGVVYLWSIAGGTFDGTGGSMSTSGNTIAFTATVGQSEVSLVVHGRNLAGDFGANGIANISVVPNVVAPVLTIATTVSAGKNNLVVSVLNPQANVTFAWKMSGSGTINGSTVAGDGSTQATGNSITYTSGSGGQIALAVTATNAASDQAMLNTTITVVPAPSGIVTVYPCCNSTGTPITAATSGLQYFAGCALDAGQGATTYSWTVDDGASGSSSSSMLTFIAGNATASIGGGAVVFAAPMHVTCRITNAAGDFKDLTESLAVYPPASAAITLNGLTTTSSVFWVDAFSEGNAASVPAQPNAVYSWSIAAPYSSTAATTSSNYSFDALINQVTAPSLQVQVTNGAGDSTASASDFVFPNPTPVAPLLQTNPYYFAGRSSPSIGLPTTAAYNNFQILWADTSGAPFYDGTHSSTALGIQSNATAAIAGTLTLKSPETGTALSPVAFNLGATPLTTGVTLALGSWGGYGPGSGAGQTARMSTSWVAVSKSGNTVMVGGNDSVGQLTQTTNGWSVSFATSSNNNFGTLADDTTLFFCNNDNNGECVRYAYSNQQFTSEEVVGSHSNPGYPESLSAVDDATLFVSSQVLDPTQIEAARFVRVGAGNWTKSIVPVPSGMGWLAVQAIDANDAWLAACTINQVRECAGVDIFLAKYSSGTGQWNLTPIIPLASLQSALYDADGPAGSAVFNVIDALASVGPVGTNQLAVAEGTSLRLVSSSDNGVTWSVKTLPLNAQAVFGQGIEPNNDQTVVAALPDGSLLWGDFQVMYQVTQPTSAHPTAALILGVPQNQESFPTGVGPAARLSYPRSIVNLDASSNRYLLLEQPGLTVMSFDPSTSTWSKTMPPGFTGSYIDDNIAQLSPNLLVSADFSSHTVSTVQYLQTGCPQGASPCFTSTVIAGSGAVGSSDGPGTSASFQTMLAAGAGDSSDVLVSDSTSLRLLTLSAGVWTTNTLTNPTGYCASNADGAAASTNDFAYSNIAALDAHNYFYMSSCTSELRLLSNASGSWTITSLRGPGGARLNVTGNRIQAADVHTLYVGDDQQYAPFIPATIFKCSQSAVGQPWSCASVFTSASGGFAPGPMGTGSMNTPGGMLLTGSNEILFSDYQESVVGILHF